MLVYSLCTLVAPGDSFCSPARAQQPPLAPPLTRAAQELGASILRDLHSQRETLMHSKATLQGTDDSITKVGGLRRVGGRRWGWCG